MKKIQFYDEAAHRFLSDRALVSYPINSLEFYAPYFNRVCKNLVDARSLEDLAHREKWESPIPFRDEILDKDHVVVVTDKNLKILYASQNMKQMNGYSPEEVLGKSPKMFQGENTCKETSRKVSSAIAKQIPFEVVLTNYKKDGSPYNCWIKGAPILNHKGELVNFIAFEKAVA